MFANRTFQFNGEIMVTSLLALAICYALSYWQWTRYQDKIAYFDLVEKQAALGLRDFPAEPGDWSEWHHAEVRVTGTFDYSREMVLRNRAKNEVGGVKVVTPLVIDDEERAVLVDRGFLPYENYADGDPAEYRPAGEQTVIGKVRPSQLPAFFLSPGIPEPDGETFVERWLRLDVEKMSAQLPYPVVEIFIEQTNQTGAIPEHDPREVLTPGRHLNYTIQWFSFGTFALGFGLFVQFRPKNKRPRGVRRLPESGKTA